MIIRLGLLLTMLTACASCKLFRKPSVQDINICIVNIPLSDCNSQDVHTTPKFPEEMSDYVVFDEVALNLFVSKKEECLESSNHTLPQQPVPTLVEMSPCVINPTKPTITAMPTCDEDLTIGLFAVDRVSWGKFYNFMRYCGERY